jgi:hypothetical protein
VAAGELTPNWRMASVACAVPVFLGKVTQRIMQNPGSSLYTYIIICNLIPLLLCVFEGISSQENALSGFFILMFQEK